MVKDPHSVEIFCKTQVGKFVKNKKFAIEKSTFSRILDVKDPNGVKTFYNT